MMDKSYRQFFALQSEPFSIDIKRKDIMVTPSLSAVQDRVQYAIRLGALALITGEIGSGKSTALRYVIGGFHPSEYKIIYITATSGSILELYRQILSELGIDMKTMDDYLRHHLAIAGVKRMLFEDAAVTAIHQGSGGLFRKANHLARGAIIAAAKSESTSVTAEHVRLSATEIL